MRTGIIILNYNDYKTTIDMINQIKNYKVLDNIIIVDNMSTDDSYKILKKYENNKIDVIRTDKNKGYASGNNYGIKYLKRKYNTDIVIISNPDIIVTENTINELIVDLENNNYISLISPLIEEKGIISRGWKLPTFIDDVLSNINFFHKFAKKRLLYKNEHYKNKLSKVDVVHGCFFMIRLNDFQKIQYFDEGTFLYYEENIIAKKLKENNLKTYIDNDVKVIHNLSISVDKSFNSIKKYKILKDSQKYYEKNYNKTNVFGIIILRLFYYISLAISYILIFLRNLGGKK